jgi:hypothetical protein
MKHVYDLAINIRKVQGFDAQTFDPTLLLRVEVLKFIRTQNAVSVQIQTSEPILCLFGK